MATLAMHRRRAWTSVIVDALVTGAGRVIGFTRRHLPVLPGLSGAALVSAGTGEIVSHVFGHGLAPWVAGFVCGWFLLKMDGQIKIRPSRGGE